VTVPATVPGEKTELLLPHLKKNAWKWSDIIVGVLLPVLIIGFMYMLRFLGFYVGPLIGIFWLITIASSYIVVALWMYRKRMGSWPFKPLTLKCFVKESLWAFLYLLLYLLTVFLLRFPLKVFLGLEDTSNWMGRYDSFKFNNFVYISVLIFTFTIVPFYEEVFYRGYLYTALKNRTHWIVAGIFNALFFAAIHRYNWFGFIEIFLAGLMLALIYEHRNRLLTPILAHAQMNFIVSMLMIVLFVMNCHVPAQNWDEAKIKPEWLHNEPPEYVEQMPSGEEQRLYAIDTWGSQGFRKTKKLVQKQKSEWSISI
jgi:membrane protease YdiL (CAAX protease family)